MRQERTRLPIPIILVALIATVLLADRVAIAGGGIGSVWVTQVTDTSLTVGASSPSGKYRHATSPPTWKICWKTAGAWVGTCSGGSSVIVRSLPYTITGLSSNTSYKIKVHVLSEKMKWGKWKSIDFRKVGTVTASTSDPFPFTLSGLLTPIGAGPNFFNTRVDIVGFGQLDVIRIAYKKTWLPTALRFVASGRSRPDTTWVTSGKLRGWVDLTPGASVPHTFSGLLGCAQYRVVAYGFKPGQEQGIFMGEAKIHTEGTGCWISFKKGVADHSNETILESYLADMAGTYPENNLFDHLANAYDPSMTADRALLASDGEPILSDVDAVDFVLYERPAVWSQWQLECNKKGGVQDLRTYVDAMFPAEFQGLVESVDDVDELELYANIGSSGLDGIYVQYLAVAQPNILMNGSASSPLIYMRAADLLHDAFPNTAVMASDASAACRIDPANTWLTGAGGYVSGDSVAVSVVPPVGLALTGPPTMTAVLFANQRFDPYRQIPPGFLLAGTASDGRAMYLATVAGDSVQDATGQLMDNRWSFDLPGDGPGRVPSGGVGAAIEPDEDRFFFPGDVIQYYIQAVDTGGGVTTVPGDISQLFNREKHNQCFSIRALPSWDVNGAIPSMIIVNGTMLAGEWDRLGGNFSQLGMTVGVDFDVFTQQVPSSDYVGSLGASTMHGTTASWLQGYQAVVVNSETIKRPMLLGSAQTLGHWSDFQVLTDYMDLAGDRGIGTSGSYIIANIGSSGLDGVAFQTDVLGVGAVSSDAGAVIGLESPSVIPATGGAAQGFGQTFAAAMFCPRPASMSELVLLQAGAVASHTFLDANGVPLTTPPAAGIWDRFDPVSLGMKRSYSSAFALDSVVGSGTGGLSASSVVLGEALNFMGVVTGLSPATGTTPYALKTELMANRPNPFNPRTTIPFRIGESGPTTLRILDLRGRVVRTLVSGSLAAGNHEANWDGRDANGRVVASGVYMVSLSSVSGNDSRRKIVLLK